MLFSRLAVRCYRNRWVRSTITHFTRLKHPKKWVFILGCYNSGTTLLANLLGLHRLIGTLPVEGVAFTSHLRMPEEFGWPRMWLNCENEIALEPRPDPGRAENIQRDWSPWYSENKPVFLEKSVSNLLRVRWLEKNFDSARFIGIIRNGFAVAAGIRNRARPSRYGNYQYSLAYPIELCAKQWQKAADVMFFEAKQLENFTLVKYEQLVREPVNILTNLWRWIGLEPEPIKFNSKILEISNTHIKVEDMNSKNISLLSEEELQKVLHEIEHGMVKFGYNLYDSVET